MPWSSFRVSPKKALVSSQSKWLTSNHQESRTTTREGDQVPELPAYSVSWNHTRWGQDPLVLSYQSGCWHHLALSLLTRFWWHWSIFICLLHCQGSLYVPPVTYLITPTSPRDTTGMNSSDFSFCRFVSHARMFQQPISDNMLINRSVGNMNQYVSFAPVLGSQAFWILLDPCPMCVPALYTQLPSKCLLSNFSWEVSALTIEIHAPSFSENPDIHIIF